MSKSLIHVAPFLLTAEEAAEALRLGRTKVYSLIATGELQSVKIGGARRIPVAALELFVASLAEQDAA